jgi:hypothetical protein
MLASLLLAACLTPPLFDLDGPPCSPVRSWLQCACSEGMAWDPEPLADWYEVRRVAVYAGSGSQVGSTTDTFWMFAEDADFPKAGTLYDYLVRACRRSTTNGAVLCGGWSNAVRYVGAPYACYDSGQEVPCYPGDPLLPVTQ